MTTEALEQSFATARGVLVNVTPDQLDLPTPCASWDVRGLVNHIVAGSHWFGRTAEAGESTDMEELTSTDFASIDFVASFDEGSKRTIAAFAAPGTLEKVVKLPFGQYPGVAFMGLATTDTFTHAWDLARATGQSTDLHPELAAQLLAGARTTISDGFRGPEESGMPFGPEVEAPEGGSNADRLAAFLGRTP